MSGPETVVSDVGSTKRELIAGLPAGERSSRFIGGHPLAGAETAGVENARAELLEGARWYLTPTDSSSGLHYDRLQRSVAGLGARPQAIDPETHDRVMATVSHLPHVLANVLVGEAAAALSEESERLPEVGTSFRDTTRVAGANPAIWGDIFATNREAVADEIAAVVERLRAAAEVIRSGDAAAVGAWHAPPARTGAGCSSPTSQGAASASFGSGPEPARDGRRDRPRARPRAGQHRGHGALPGSGHAHRRDLDLGRRRRRGRARLRGRARPRPRRPASPPRRVGGRWPTRFDPRVAARHADGAAGQVGLPPGGDPRRDGGGLDEDRGLSRRRRHPLDARRGGGARSAGHSRRARTASGGIELTVDGVGLRGARGAEIDVGNAGTLLRLLPGWLAGQPDREWTLDGDESIRRRPVDRVVEPLARMGAADPARDGRLPPLAVRGAPLSGIDYRMPVASAQVKSCVLLAGLLADGRRG